MNLYLKVSELRFGTNILAKIKRQEEKEKYPKIELLIAFTNSFKPSVFSTSVVSVLIL